MEFFTGLTKAILSVLIVVLVWWYYPQAINNIMDVNLEIIRVTAHFFPEPYGAQVESAIRFLAGEKALIFFESGLAVAFVFKYVFRM